jgi:ABC-type branched-subunit amino acid transport system substrate-binding protein
MDESKRSMMRLIKSLVPAAIALSLLAAACSSSSKSASQSSTTAANTGATASKAPSGTPIKLGIIASIQSTFNPEPYVPQAAKVAAAAVNAAGGVMGRPVQVVVCDDHETPQGASLCAQQLLVQDKVFMMVGDDGFEEAAVLPTIAAQNTIDWATLGSSTAALSSPLAYIFVPIFASLDAVPQMLPSNVTNVAFFNVDTAVNVSSFKSTKAIFPAADHLTNILIPPTATSFDTYCLQLKNSGAQAVIAQLPNNQIPPAIQACHQLGLTNVTWVNNSALLNPSTDNLLSTYNQPNFVFESFSQSAINQFEADIAKYGPQVGGVSNPYNDSSVIAWLGVKLLPTLVQEAGAGLNAAKIKTWLDTQTAFNTMGATPPINFTATPLPALPRVKNVSSYKAEIQNGKLVYPDPQQVFTPKA